MSDTIVFLFVLLQELDKAWKMVDTAHEKEKKDRETIKNLKEDITNLTKKIKQQTGYSRDQEQREVKR